MGFSPYLRSGANVVHEIWHTWSTFTAESARTDRKKLTSFCRFYRPPKFAPKIWGPISPDWGHISGRALHHSVGVRSLSKFAAYQNFCGSTLSGSKLRGKIAKISPKFLRSNLGVFRGTYVYEIFGDVKVLPSGRLWQKLRQLTS